MIMSFRLRLHTQIGHNRRRAGAIQLRLAGCGEWLSDFGRFPGSYCMTVSRQQSLLCRSPIHKHDPADEFCLLLSRIACGLTFADLWKVARRLGDEAIAALLSPPLGLDGRGAFGLEASKSCLESCGDLYNNTSSSSK